MSLHHRLMLVSAAAAVGAAAVVPAAGLLVGPTATGCVVRFTTTGPAILDDGKHVCNGATSVSVLSNGDLEIRSEPRGPIVSVTVDEDETLSARGILAGASVATGRTTVRFYSTRTGARVRADSTTLQGGTSNIWVTWTHTGQ